MVQDSSGVNLLGDDVTKLELLGVGVLQLHGSEGGQRSGSSGARSRVRVRARGRARVRVRVRVTAVVVSGRGANGTDVSRVRGQRVNGSGSGGEGGRRGGGSSVGGERRLGGETGLEDTAGGGQDVVDLNGRRGREPSKRSRERLVDEPVLPEVEADLGVGLSVGELGVGDNSEDVGELKLLDGDVLEEPPGPGGLQRVALTLLAESVGLGVVDVGSTRLERSKRRTLEDGQVKVLVVGVLGEGAEVGGLVVLAGEGVVVLESVGLGQEGQVLGDGTARGTCNILADNEVVDQSSVDSALSDTEAGSNSVDDILAGEVAAVTVEEAVVGEGVQGRARSTGVGGTGSSVVLRLETVVTAAVSNILHGRESCNSAQEKGNELSVKDHFGFGNANRKTE